MTQCTFRRFKQFTLVFFLSWAFVTFFANQKELVERFARQILSENQASRVRTQTAKEFFEAHRIFVDKEEVDEEIQEKQGGKELAPAPVEVQVDKLEAGTQNTESPRQIESQPIQTTEPLISASERKQTIEQAKETKSSQPEKEQKKEERKVDEEKKQKEIKQKEAQKKSIPSQKQGKKEEKSQRQEKEQKKQKIQGKPQKSNKQERESHKNEKQGKKSEKNKKE